MAILKLNPFMPEAAKNALNNFLFLSEYHISYKSIIRKYSKEKYRLEPRVQFCLKLFFNFCYFKECHTYENPQISRHERIEDSNSIKK